jgi:hypothetical protein
MKYTIKLILLLSLIFYSCTNETVETNKVSNLTANKYKLIFKLDGEEKINFSSNLNEGKVTSSFSFKDKNVNYNLEYEIDISISHWKLKQSDKVIQKSEDLISKNISSKTLVVLTKSLEQFYENNYKTLIDNSDPLLISMLNYYKSIFNVANNSILNKEDCECTVHPAFLLEKTNFNCQEEQFIKVNELKEILYNYKTENSEIDSSTTNLIRFLDNTNQRQIRFDEYYSYYISKDNYELVLSNFLNPQISAKKTNPGDCAWWCPLGCGSDHGCCGNYSGCCLYWDPACYIHDQLCTDCQPAWFCLPGCQPD